MQLVSFPYYTTQGCVRRTTVGIHDSSQVPAVDALVLPELPLFDESIGFPNQHLLVLLLLLCANQEIDFYGRKDEMEVILLPCATKKAALKDHVKSHTERLEEEVEQAREEVKLY